MKKILLSGGLVLIADESKIVESNHGTKIMDLNTTIDSSLVRVFNGQLMKASSLMNEYDSRNPNKLDWLKEV